MKIEYRITLKWVDAEGEERQCEIWGPQFGLHGEERPGCDPVPKEYWRGIIIGGISRAIDRMPD